MGRASKDTIHVCTMRREQHALPPSLGGGRVAHPEGVGGRGGEARLGERRRQCSTEERVLEGVVWLHPLLRVVVQHLEDEVLESVVIARGMAKFTLTNATRTTNLHAQYVVKGTTPGTTIHVLEGGREGGQ